MPRQPNQEINAEAVLNDADREELEQLRAEREVRLAQQKADEDNASRDLHRLVLNLPPAAGEYISLANKLYYNGKEYQVSTATKWALEEAERRAWCHESSLHESENKGRRAQNRRIG